MPPQDIFRVLARALSRLLVACQCHQTRSEQSFRSVCGSPCGVLAVVRGDRQRAGRERLLEGDLPVICRASDVATY